MNASIPELNAHVQYKTDKFMAGMQVDYSNIMPYVKYGTNPVRISKERVQAVTFMAYTKVTGKKVGFKAMAVLGQNTTHWVMIGGYYGYKATPNSIETYKPAKTKCILGRSVRNRQENGAGSVCRLHREQRRQRRRYGRLWQNGRRFGQGYQRYVAGGPPAGNLQW